MRKMLCTAVAAAIMATGAGSAQAVIVNLNGVTNASLDGTNSVDVLLSGGTYSLSFVSSLFTAFTRFSNVSGCDVNGANCTTGYENSARYVINGNTFGFGDGFGNGGLGPISPGDAYYANAATSFANSGGYSAQFSLAAPTTVSFYIVDDNLGDNSGGVSLSVASVPEPATWGLMVLGFGGLGYSMRSRRKSMTNFA